MRLTEKSTPYWISGSRPLPADVVRQYALPSDTAQFLTEIGLPFGDKQFTQTTSFALYDDPSKLHSLKRSGEEYLVLGEAEGGHLCITVVTGVVVIIYNLDREPPCFVNSSVKNLSTFAEAYRQLWAVFEGKDEDKLRDALVKLRSELTAIDPKAFQPDAFWQDVLRDQELMFGVVSA